MAIILRSDGEHSSHLPENGTDFQLDELYQMLNCELIEIVRLDEMTGLIIVCDEEGLLKSSPINIAASKMVGTPIADAEKPLEILRTIHSFDPCLACAVHVMDGKGTEIVKVRAL